MFGLLSDLDECMWRDYDADIDGKIPKDKMKLADGTYKPWGLVKHESVGPDTLHYYLNSNAGSPNEGVLLGAKRNPLKDVGHCWMTFVNKKPGNLITGIAIEDDWVLMRNDFLDSLGEPEAKVVEEKPELQRGLTIDMGVYGDLIHGKWEKKGKPPRGKGKLGYHYYEIVRCEEFHVGQPMNVYLSKDDGTNLCVNITEIARDPFHSLSKAFLKIVDNCIVGIMVEDDWVERQ